MIKPAALHEMLDRFEFVPQAIIAEPTNRVAKRLGQVPEKGHDFDEYQGADAISATSEKLRYIHLSTRLKTPSILSDDQIAQYNRLRGHADPNPLRQRPARSRPGDVALAQRLRVTVCCSARRNRRGGPAVTKLERVR